MTLPSPVLDALTDVQIVALTLFGEARGEGPDGRIAVANVIANRVAAQRTAFGGTAREVCLKPAQFSCWSDAGGPLNHRVLLDTAVALARGEVGPVLRECLWIADGLLRRQFVDNTHGATHYLTTDLLATAPPAWAQGQTVRARIGAHAFLRVA